VLVLILPVLVPCHTRKQSFEKGLALLLLLRRMSLAVTVRVSVRRVDLSAVDVSAGRGRVSTGRAARVVPVGRCGRGGKVVCLGCSS
jgi:hypothetical protein